MVNVSNLSKISLREFQESLGKVGQARDGTSENVTWQVTYFFHRIAEHAATDFLENHKVTALVIGGPGPTKQDFSAGDYLHYELKNALIAVVDTQSAGKEGVREVLDKSSGTIKNMCAPEEKMVMQRLLAEMNKEDGLATYGLYSVLNALEKGEVEVTLANDSTDMIEIVAMCKKCGQTKAKIINKSERTQTVQEMLSSPCEKCKAVDYEVEEKDIVDVLEDLASQTNATVEVISTESEEKAKLAALGGFAALLRYRAR